MNIPTFEEYINANVKPDDWNNLSESINDSLFTNNVLDYFSGYMKTHGVHLLSEFWNSASDANTLECESQDEQILAFREWVSKKF